jgi:hypothetical protein
MLGVGFSDITSYDLTTSYLAFSLCTLFTCEKKLQCGHYTQEQTPLSNWRGFCCDIIFIIIHCVGKSASKTWFKLVLGLTGTYCVSFDFFIVQLTDWLTDWRAVIAQSVYRWATGWTIGVLGCDSRRGLGIFLFTTASRTALGRTQPPIQWIPGALSLGVWRQGREGDRLPPSSAEAKEWVELYLYSPIRLHGVVLS